MDNNKAIEFLKNEIRNYEEVFEAFGIPEMPKEKADIKNAITTYKKIINLLKLGEKYEQMWEELEKIKCLIIEFNNEGYHKGNHFLSEIKQKYFKPKPKNKEEKIDDIITAVRDSYAYLDRPNSSERDEIIDMIVGLRDEGDVNK